MILRLIVDQRHESGYLKSPDTPQIICQQIEINGYVVFAIMDFWKCQVKITEKLLCKGYDDDVASEKSIDKNEDQTESLWKTLPDINKNKLVLKHLFEIPKFSYFLKKYIF